MPITYEKINNLQSKFLKSLDLGQINLLHDYLESDLKELKKSPKPPTAKIRIVSNSKSDM